jgi:hypothetical protein
MALPFDAVKLVQAGLAAAERAGCASQSVLSLGYPDILAAEGELKALFGGERAAGIEYRADSETIARWHGLPGGQRIPDSLNFFALLGYDLEVLDVAPVRGGELIHDLNQPVPERLHARYALVIDPGTLEHCFNIAQAAKNVAHMVAPAGCVFHGNPLNMYNHGFYNLHPTWYHDFYLANGFQIETMCAIANPARAPQRYEVPATARFAQTVPESSVYLLARRVAMQPIVWPTQTKYRNNPGLKG